MACVAHRAGGASGASGAGQSGGAGVAADSAVAAVAAGGGEADSGVAGGAVAGVAAVACVAAGSIGAAGGVAAGSAVAAGAAGEAVAAVGAGAATGHADVSVGTAAAVATVTAVARRTRDTGAPQECGSTCGPTGASVAARPASTTGPTAGAVADAAAAGPTDTAGTGSPGLPPGPTGTAMAEQPRRPAGATGLTDRTGAAGATVTPQNSASPTGLPGPRHPIGAIADQRPPKPVLAGCIHQTQHVLLHGLQPRDAGRLASRVAVAPRGQQRDKALIEGRDPGADGLIFLGMGAEQGRDRDRHLIGTGGQHRRRGARRRCVDRIDRRTNARQIRSRRRHYLGRHAHE